MFGEITYWSNYLPSPLKAEFSKRLSNITIDSNIDIVVLTG